MTLFLTKEEIVELTGVRHRKSQIDELNKNGIVWRQRGDGEILVLRGYVENQFGLNAKKTHTPKQMEPDFTGLR